MVNQFVAMAESRRHQNLLQTSGGNINVAASSSAATSSSSSVHMNSLGQAENAVMIPLSVADLDVLRANGLQFSAATTLSNIVNSSSNEISGGDNNLNLSFSGGNVILSSTVDSNANDGLHGPTHSIIMDTGGLVDRHQRQHRQLQHQQNFQSIARSGNRAVLHSNEISSNGIMDPQSLATSSVSGNIISLGNNDNMITSGVNSSASGLIQALGAAVSRAVASGSFPNLLSSSMNLPLSVNQSSIINGSEIMALNAIPTNIISGANGQLLLNQQHNRHQHHQPHQLVLNQVSGLVEGGSIISSTPTVNIHHAALGSSSGIGNRAGDGTVTAQPGQGNSAGVTVTLGSQQQQQQQQQMWVQPDQSGFLPAAVNLTAQEALSLQGDQGSISIQGSSSSQDRGTSLQELQQAHIDGSQYQDVRAQFAGVFHMQAQGNRPVSYQVAAHSTLEQASPSHDFQDIGDDSEATPSYSNIQQMSVDNQVAVNAAAHLIAAPTVDSSTLQQGYQFVYDAENRVLTVQRVMSPSDCTVSQSTLSLEGSEAQANASLLPISSQPSQSYTMVHVSSMPSSEVSTSSMAAMLSAHGRAGGSGISSLSHGHAASSSHSLVSVSKLEKVELDGVAECDTTQEDLEFHQHRSPSYLDTSNNIDDDQSLDSTSLHSTIQGSGVATSGEVIMDSTLDSSDLTTLHPVTMATGEIVNSQHPLVSGVKSVNLGTRNNLESMPGPSGLQALRVSKSSDAVLTLNHGAVANKIIRKSRRLQLVEQEPKASQRKRDYQTQHYNLDMLWCEDCMQAYEPSCPVHKLSVVPDKIVMSRAWASAPNQVQIFRIPEAHLEPGDSNMGVQAKRQIPKFTQFGPFVGELVDSMENVTGRFFPLMLEYSDGSCKYFETEDENKCNWMMFVRPAKTFAEQNLVAFQYKGDIYFNVTRLIECRQELKVWYAAHYAERLGVRPLKMTEEDLQALDEEDAKFGCFECSRKFRTSAALQQHLITHDNDDIKDFDEAGSDDEDFNVGEDTGRKADKQKGTYLRGKLTQGKKRSANTDMGSYQWKKKSTSIYINKTLKKYKKRQQYSEKVSQSMRSIFTRHGKVSGGNEWMCTHCELTFDNSSLLNLHTLTHAAEDLGMDEMKKLAEEQNGEMTQPGGSLQAGVNGDINVATLAAVMSLSTPMVACPKCNIVFNDQRSLMEHVATHGQKQPIKKERPFGCNECSKSFTTEDKLLKHQMVHGDDADKPLECPVCFKRVMNNSAMACHMKTHSDRKYYDCPVCGEDFDVVANLREHSAKHMDEMGHFPCPTCSKTFYDFGILKKHMKTFHSDRVFDCPECNKPFPRVDKLRLHMLRHTSHKEFMCETCGKQFKRKDKFHEHKKRMHSKERMERQLAAKQKQNSLRKIGKFTPKVRPSEYHRFIYKCHTCLLGFKRRGMLVNHLAKRHPEIKPEQVPELNLPILKTQKDFYCQYCDKIYKSSSKRKAHIQKNHPGCQVPPSSWKKTIAPDGTRNSPSNTYSHTVSSITTMPHGCKFCHKQYASKAKLLQHQRKSHSELVEPVYERRRLKRSQQQQDFIHITVTDGTHGLTERYETVPIAVVTQADSLPSADLLTQAMSELHSYASEFTISPRLTQGGAPTMVHIQSNGQVQPTTIDISQLNQALHSFTTQTGTVATVLAQPPQSTSPTQSVTVVAPNGPQTINLSNTQFITRAWTGGFTPSFR